MLRHSRGKIELTESDYNSSDDIVGGSVNSVVESDIDKFYTSDDVNSAEEISNIHNLIKNLAIEGKNDKLDMCVGLSSRDMFLGVLIANGYDLDAAYLRAICFDDPVMYLKKKSVIVRACKDYLLARPGLCATIMTLKDSIIEQYTSRAKINKSLVMQELVKLKDLCMENPNSFDIALKSLQLIGGELGMFGKNVVNNVLDDGMGRANFANVGNKDAITSRISDYLEASSIPIEEKVEEEKK